MAKNILKDVVKGIFFPTLRKQGAKFTESAVLAPLYDKKYKLSDGQIVHKHINDVTLLFDQSRIESTVGTDTINAWLKQMNSQSTDSFSELRKNVSDDQLLDFVKSRNIQTLSELQLWNNYLAGEYNKEVAEYEKSKTVDVDVKSVEPTSELKTE